MGRGSWAVATTVVMVARAVVVAARTVGMVARTVVVVARAVVVVAKAVTRADVMIAKAVARTIVVTMVAETLLRPPGAQTKHPPILIADNVDRNTTFSTNCKLYNYYT